jgi:hypothetical protein
MSSLHDLLDQIAERVPTPKDGYERTKRRAERRLLFRRLRAGTLAILVVTIPLIVVLRTGGGKSAPPVNAPSDPWDNLSPGLHFIPSPPQQDRVGASVVWTGQVLVDWGGAVRDGEQLFNDGFAYEPDASAWVPLPESPLSPRSSAGGVWTGNEVLIWGGWDGHSGFFADGAAYNPSTYQWRALPEAPIAGRRPLAAVWTGQEMLIWGAGSPQDNPDVTGAAYDPESNTWRRLPDAPFSLNDGQAVWTGQDLIVVGKGDSAHINAARGLEYDIVTNKWKALPSPDLYPWVGMIWNGSEVLVLDYAGEARALDPETNEWVAASPPPLDHGEWIPQVAYSSGDTFVVSSLGVAVLSAGRWLNLTDEIARSDGYPLEGKYRDFGYVPVAAGRAIVLLPYSPDKPASMPVWVVGHGS